MDPLADLRSVLRSHRQPIDLERYRTIYQRTRRALGVIIPLVALALAGRFDPTQSAVGGVGDLGFLILLHALVRSGPTFLEMVLIDTAAYLGMAIFVDSPETTLFVARRRRSSCSTSFAPGSL